MKRKLMIVGVTCIVLAGGAISVGAFSEQKLNKDVITHEKVEETALAKISGSIESIELEKEHGRLEYHVDVRGENGEVIEVDIDAVTGEVVKVEDEVDDDYKVVASSKDQKIETKLTKEDAIAIATKDTTGKVVKFEYDEGHYEIEIHTETHEVDYEIDARTGKIMEKDIDMLNDDERYDD
ncbi:hypothetical protein FZW96_16600 [Bacillus sp. BGMRC 2118]|nr:hypothetical protein FZW96_16600 [Bacillus sp. BGMRC 2118]